MKNVSDVIYDCPQCGEETETLHEGFCEDCRKQNQEALDEHNYWHDRYTVRNYRK